MPLLKNNPALNRPTAAEQLISTSGTAAPQAAPADGNIKYVAVEKRNRRVSTLTTGSLHARLKARAEAEGRSVNDLVNSILEENV